MAKVKNEETQQTKKQAVDEEIKTHHSLNIQAPIRVSNKQNDRLYIEYLLGDSQYGKTNKLAFLGKGGFDTDYLVGKDNYADKEDNFFGSASKATLLSNEKIKNDLAKEYFQRPEEYTLKTVNMILENLEKKYSFTEQELEQIGGLDSKSAKSRENLIKLTEDKMRIGDKALLQGLKTISSIADTYRKAISVKEESSTKTITESLRRHIKENVFGSTADFDWDSLGKDSRVVKENIKDLAMSANSLELKEYLNKIGYASGDTSKKIVSNKAEGIIKTFQDTMNAHEEIQSRINLSSVINSDVRLKEQFLSVADALNSIGIYKETIRRYANGSVSKKQLDKEKEMFADTQKRFTDNSEAYTGVLAVIDKNNMEKYNKNVKSGVIKETKNGEKKPHSLVEEFQSLGNKKIESKKDLTSVLKSLGRFEKAMSRGLLVYAKNGLAKDISNFSDLDVSDEAKVQIHENYQNLAKNILKRENGARFNGIPFNINEMDALHKEFEENNNKIILGDIKDNLAKEFVADNMGNLQDLSVEINNDNNMIEKTSEIMNAYNLAENASIDAQPDQIKMMAEQSVNDEGLREAVVDKVQNKTKGQDINKGDFENRISEIAGAKNHLRLKSLSKEFDSSINRFMLPRETLSRFKSCLSNSVVAKTNMETLSSTTAQCADKLLTDLKQDIQKLGTAQQQLGQGLASVLPFHLLFAVREEYLHLTERDFIDSQEKIGDEMVKIMQDLNTASNESDKEARLELINIEEQGGVSFSTVHHSEASDFKNSLSKEKIAEDLSASTYLGSYRTIEQIIADKNYGLNKEKFSILEEGGNDSKISEDNKLSLAGLDALTTGIDNLIHSENSQKKVNLSNDTNENKISKAVSYLDLIEADKETENGKSLRIFGEKRGGVNNASLFKEKTNSQNSDLKDKNKEHITSTEPKKQNRASLEYILKKIDARQKKLSIDYFNERENISAEDYGNQMESMEKDKQTVQKELLLASLVEMESDLSSKNFTQPKEKIRDSIIKLKQALRDPNDTTIKHNGSHIATVALSKTDKKSIVSEALDMLKKNNKSMNNTFITMRDTASLKTVHQKGENNIDVIQTATGKKAYFLNIFENNKEYLKDRSNNFESEKNLAYESMKKVSEGTSLENNINTLDSYTEMFLEKSGNSRSLTEADKGIKSVQRNDHISSKTNEMGF